MKSMCSRYGKSCLKNIFCYHFSFVFPQPPQILLIINILLTSPLKVLMTNNLSQIFINPKFDEFPLLNIL